MDWLNNMTEELFDIVDKDDNVIGQATYAEARENNKIIRVVHNWIINDEGKVLFQFRSAHKVAHPRCFYASAGGRVDAGENYDIAVVRETKEELGIDVAPKFIGKLLEEHPTDNKFIGLYFSTHNGPFTGWEVEADALEWMTFEEIDSMRKRFPYLFAGNGSLDTFLNYAKENGLVK